MLLPPERGPVSRRVADTLRAPHLDLAVQPPLVLGPEPVVHDADVQLALWMLYELAFRGFDDVAAEREWDSVVIGMRRVIERRFEAEVRAGAESRLDEVDPQGSVAEEILAMVARENGPSPAAYLHRHASREELVWFLVERSVAQLKESDPQSFLLPRLTGAAKVALAEVQYDEYGAGRPERLHQTLYADALTAVGVDPSYGAHVSSVSGTSLALANLPSFLALNRRLRGVAAGHFAAFEASSSVPSRKIALGLERVGLPPAASAYFHEHVEADSAHEQVAVRDLCGSLVAQEPDLRDDVLLGAAACLWLDDLSAHELLERWTPAEKIA